MRLFLGLVCLWISTAVGANTVLKPFTVEYEVSKNDYFLGSTQKTLRQKENDLWEITAVTQPEGLVALFFSEKVTESSLIRYRKSQLQPLAYRYDKRGGKKAETFKVDYNYQTSTLTHSWLNEQHPLAGNQQDLLSFQVAMMLALQAGQRKMRFTIADKKRIEQYDLKTAGEETLTTELGKLHTIKLEYIDTQRQRRYTFWCAKELDYLPYMTRRIEADGDVILLKLRRYNNRPARLSPES